MRYNDTVTKFLGNRHTAIIGAEEPVARALDIMQRENIDALGIQAGRKFAGIFTRSDFVRRVLCKDINPRKVSVDAVMTCDPIAIGPSVSLRDAYKIMLDHKISHLPVLSPDDRTFLGIITEEDLRYDMNNFLEKTANENRMIMSYIHGENYAMGGNY